MEGYKVLGTCIDPKTKRKLYKVECVKHSICYTQRTDSFKTQQGCRLCKLESQLKRQVKSLDYHVSLFKKVHGDLYDYSKVVYINSKKLIEIICKEHGSFWQRPGLHKEGSGCKACAGNALKTLEEFKEQASLKHNNFYDYRDFEYINNQTKSTIICPNHGSFKQNSNSHLNGTGCPKCFVRAGANKEDFKICCEKNKGFGFLYIIECYNDTESFYKVGITSNDVKTRFKSKTSMPYSYTIKQVVFDTAENVFEMESLLHAYYKDYSYTPSIKFNGYTECFKLDVN